MLLSLLGYNYYIIGFFEEASRESPTEDKDGIFGALLFSLSAVCTKQVGQTK